MDKSENINERYNINSENTEKSTEKLVLIGKILRKNSSIKNQSDFSKKYPTNRKQGLDCSLLIDPDKTKNLMEIIKCQICFQIMVDPVDCSGCQKSFCADCIYYLKEKNKSCPYGCNLNDSEPKISSVAIKGVLSLLKFSCENIECKAEFAYNEYLQHEQNCNFLTIICPNLNCNKNIRKFELEKHVKYECEYNKFTCDTCRGEYEKKNFSSHKHTCESFYQILIRHKNNDDNDNSSIPNNFNFDNFINRLIKSNSNLDLNRNEAVTNNDIDNYQIYNENISLRAQNKCDTLKEEKESIKEIVKKLFKTNEKENNVDTSKESKLMQNENNDENDISFDLDNKTIKINYDKEKENYKANDNLYNKKELTAEENENINFIINESKNNNNNKNVNNNIPFEFLFKEMFTKIEKMNQDNSSRFVTLTNSIDKINVILEKIQENEKSILERTSTKDNLENKSHLINQTQNFSQVNQPKNIKFYEIENLENSSLPNGKNGRSENNSILENSAFLTNMNNLHKITKSEFNLLSNTKNANLNNNKKLINEADSDNNINVIALKNLNNEINVQSGEKYQTCKINDLKTFIQNNAFVNKRKSSTSKKHNSINHTTEDNQKLQFNTKEFSLKKINYNNDSLKDNKNEYLSNVEKISAEITSFRFNKINNSYDDNESDYTENENKVNEIQPKIEKVFKVNLNLFFYIR